MEAAGGPEVALQEGATRRAAETTKPLSHPQSSGGAAAAGEELLELPELPWGGAPSAAGLGVPLRFAYDGMAPLPVPSAAAEEALL